MRQHVDAGDLEPGTPQTGRDLGADQAHADHHRALGAFARLHQRFDVARGSHDQHAFELHARDLGNDRGRAHRQYEVAVFDHVAALQRDALALAIDRLDAPHAQARAYLGHQRVGNHAFGHRNGVVVDVGNYAAVWVDLVLFDDGHCHVRALLADRARHRAPRRPPTDDQYVDLLCHFLSFGDVQITRTPGDRLKASKKSQVRIRRPHDASAAKAKATIRFGGNQKQRSRRKEQRSEPQKQVAGARLPFDRALQSLAIAPRKTAQRPLAQTRVVLRVLPIAAYAVAAPKDMIQRPAAAPAAVSTGLVQKRHCGAFDQAALARDDQRAAVKPTCVRRSRPRSAGALEVRQRRTNKALFREQIPREHVAANVVYAGPRKKRPSFPFFTPFEQPEPSQGKTAAPSTRCTAALQGLFQRRQRLRGQ
jgi:hypothetical protein